MCTKICIISQETIWATQTFQNPVEFYKIWLFYNHIFVLFGPTNFRAGDKTYKYYVNVLILLRDDIFNWQQPGFEPAIPLPDVVWITICIDS